MPLHSAEKLNHSVGAICDIISQQSLEFHTVTKVWKCK